MTARKTKAPIRDIRGLKPFIGKWFGGLRLLSVEHSHTGPKVVNMAMCRMVCKHGHENKIRWYRLRKSQSPRCDTCFPPTKNPEGRQAVQPSTISKAIAELEPLRYQLFKALLISRRGVARIDDTPLANVVNDCLIYAPRGCRPGGRLSGNRPADKRHPHSA